MKISLHPVPQSLDDLRRFLGRALGGVPPEEADPIVLAVQEAATNYMKHAEKAAAGNPLVVEVDRSGSCLTVRIPCFCRQGAEKTIAPRALDEVRPGGIGTHFIQEIMDRVEYEPEGEGFMTLILTKNLTSPGREETDRG